MSTPRQQKGFLPTAVAAQHLDTSLNAHTSLWGLTLASTSQCSPTTVSHLYVFIWGLGVTSKCVGLGVWKCL